MSLQKGFLRRPQVKPDSWLVFSGVLLSAVMTFAFYFFFLYFAEAFRKALSDIHHSVLLMETNDVKFHSYSLALVSSVIGQSFGLRLILQNMKRPRHLKTLLSQRLSLHVVDTTLWYWLYWCTKLLSLLGIFFIAISMQYHLNIREDIGLVFFLFSIGWFFNNWLNAYRIFRQKYFKYLSLAFLYLILSTFIFGNISLIDHNTLNGYIKNSYPEYKYDMELAKSRTQFTMRRAHPKTKIHIIRDGQKTKVIFQKFDSNPLKLTDPIVGERILQIKQSFPQVDQDNLRFIITADAGIPTAAILAFERILSSNKINRILYRTSVENSKYPWHYPPFQRTGLPKTISPDCPVARQTLDNFKKAGYKANQIEWPDFGCYRLISHLEGNRVLVKRDSSGFTLNNTPITEQGLLNTLTKLIQKYEGELTVLYQPHAEVSFAEYLKGRDLIFQSYLTNRKRLALEKYGFEYEYNSYTPDSRLINQYRYIQRTYPVRILELTEWNLEFYKFLKK